MFQSHFVTSLKLFFPRDMMRGYIVTVYDNVSILSLVYIFLLKTLPSYDEAGWNIVILVTFSVLTPDVRARVVE